MRTCRLGEFYRLSLGWLPAGAECSCRVAVEQVYELFSAAKLECPTLWGRRSACSATLPQPALSTPFLWQTNPAPPCPPLPAHRLYESVIVQEFCDRGNLSDAIMAGKFRDPATQQLELVRPRCERCALAALALAVAHLL